MVPHTGSIGVVSTLQSFKDTCHEFRPSLKRKKWMSVIAVITTTTMILTIQDGSFDAFTITTKLAQLANKGGVNITLFSNFPQSKCLSNMTRGHWKTRPITKKEKDDIIAFLNHAHSRFMLPRNYERRDGKCGNVSHTGNSTAHWFRALCDPTGPHPCCFNNQCVNKSVKECVCKDCYDMRQMKHAEYSKWIPASSDCPYKEHSPEEACRILQGSTVIFVGDSLIRHLYTALLLVVTGNQKDGAMRHDIPLAQQKQCYGLYMFTEKFCLGILQYKYDACNGTVHMTDYYYFDNRFGPDIKNLVAASEEKTIIVAGIGIHSNFNAIAVQTGYLLPSLTYMKSNYKTWPRLLWANTHAPGILKSPVVLAQTYNSVKKFNSDMELFLKSWNIPVFDTFNLTDGMTSFDGLHYGLGMNTVKANLFLSYVEEMRRVQAW